MAYLEKTASTAPILVGTSSVNVSGTRRMMAMIFADQALASRDNFCMNYLKALRPGVF